MLVCLVFAILFVNGRKVRRWLGITIITTPFKEYVCNRYTNQHETFVSKFGYGMTNQSIYAIRSGKMYYNNIIFSKRFINGCLLR
jgi:uncharacterized membrane protein